jgi:hypothetical protein
MSTSKGLEPVEKIQELVHAVIAADRCFEIWRVLTLKNTQVDTTLHIKGFGSHREFFISSIHAHLVAWVMALYRPFDSGSEVSLVTCSALRLKLGKAANDTFRIKLGLAHRIAIRLAGVRNQLFGHRADISAEAVFDEAKLSRNELRRLIDLARELVDELRAAWNLPTVMWPPNGVVADTARLLDKLA